MLFHHVGGNRLELKRRRVIDFFSLPAGRRFGDSGRARGREGTGAKFASFAGDTGSLAIAGGSQKRRVRNSNGMEAFSELSDKND